MKQISSLLLAFILLFSSCSKNQDSHSSVTGTFSSDEVTMFGGKAKTWINMTNGVPQQLAISITDATMNSLPTDGDDEIETPVSLPAMAAGATILDHVVIDWNPHGHPPIGVYSFPHFDFHFYTISKEEQTSIPAYEDDSTGFLKYPAPQYMPANYVPIPGGEPEMGTHWVDVTSPEMNGAAFTQTFIYGSYNGNVNFYEPMMTKAFLDTTTTFERSIPQPAEVTKEGYYPTQIRVSKHDGVTEIILDGFIQRVLK